MSKSSTASASAKNPPQLSAKSAWSKGPPQTNSQSSPRSQSPVPTTPVSATANHSRRPSTLGQGVPIKDGVSIPRNTVGAAKTGSAVSFGSIDDASASISSQPAAAAPTVTPTISAAIAVKSEGVKSFGTVPATVASQVNGKNSVTTKLSASQSTASTSTGTSSSSTSGPSIPTTAVNRPKVDVRKLFQTPSSTPSSQTPSDTSPSVRSSNLPPQQPPTQQQPPIPASGSSSQIGSHAYPTFVPQNGFRSQPQSTAGQPPRSPVYSRPQMPNGTGPRPSNGSGPPGPNQIPPALGSPRLTPHPQPGQPNQMPPQMPPPQMQVPGWPGYYYPPVGPDNHVFYQHWGYIPQQHPGMPPQHPQHPQMPHHQPPPAGHAPPQPHAGMPMSPRNPPQHLQGPPGTPTPQHVNAVPHTPHPPPPLSHSSSNSISGISSPPPTPAVSSPSVGGQRPLNTGASAFTPRANKVKITNAEGAEVSLDKFKHHQHTPSSGNITTPPTGSTPSLTASPSRKGIKIENPREKEAERKKKEAEERAKREAEEKAKREAEEKERKEAEERERKQRKAAEQRKKEEELKKQEERKRKEEEELKKKEQEERKRKEKEEEERKRKEKEEVELRKKKEEEERKKKEEEEERARKEREDQQRKEEQRKKEEEEKEKERIRIESEARTKREMEEKARLLKEAEDAAAAAKVTEAVKAQKEEEEKEEGELVEEEPAQVVEKEKKSLKIETETPSVRRRPGPLDLSTASRPNIPQALPSALATARIIDDLGRVTYPEGVKSPRVELNINAKDGKFRYDREFLLQFMSICKEKPDMLPPLDAIGLEPADTSQFKMSRGGSGHHGMKNGGRQASLGSLSFGGASGFTKPGSGPSFGGMGNFATANTAKLTSEERFQLSNGGRSVSVGGPGASPFARPAQMQRTASQGGPGGNMDNRRTRSKRGEKRQDMNKQPGGQPHGGSGFGGGHAANAGLGLEPVAPLQATENRWDRKALSTIPADSPEVVDRKVKALLNKITMEKFDPISDQIITWANRSEKEKDGRTLIQVIRLVFEKATDEATFSEMYARLCRKMMEQISPQVQDDGIKNSEGKPIAGGQLFRKYLLNRCQEDFERGWVAKEATAAAAAAKSLEDQVKASEKKNEGEEIALYSDEYYAAQKAKRQGLGLIRFIGELFKLQMLTERIMHECVKKLLGNVENPEEEEIESLCKLLSTVGQILDTPKARAHMDVYFSRMKELTNRQNVSSRMQFMLQDVIELRERKWATRSTVTAAPQTISQIREQAIKADQAKETYARNLSMSRSGSRRGAERPEAATNPEGWAVAGGGGNVRPPSKAGDLSKFGQISNKGAPMTFGPSSVFNKKEAKRESLSRTNSSANMFQMLQNDAVAEGSTSRGSRPPSRKSSIDLTHGGMSMTDQPPQRKRLILQPRSRPLEDDNHAPESENNSEAETEEPEAEMSEAEVKKKIAEDTKEFFAVRNLDEAEVYFQKLPPQFHYQLVDKLVSFALESKEADAQLVSDLLQRVDSKSLASPAALEDAFSSIAEFLDDVVVDAPKAPNFFALILKGAGFSDEQRTLITSKSEGNGRKVFELSS
ncbi:hypothetical protein E1B28_010177 [Marasmius oreades]|uniref:MI domain-containing protein n=1 Tax=Marasmius oreades TaxID=181124 RepID=A0A9P7RY19_9AGAR|nr:uncharacterized protein E1B28_010177 [Marasmius oreades]KAG7091123.1 hypothetical protein E1B28_010177 [Marasmius oreades]